MAFISGPPCPLASRGGGFGQWDPGGDGGCRLLNLRLLWVGRVPPSPLLSPPPAPTQAYGGNGVAAWPGLPGTVPGNLCLHLCPKKARTPGRGDSWSP